MSSSKAKTTIAILIITFTYSIVRYHVIKGISWEHFPLYISNKAISLSAVFFIALSYGSGSLTRFFPSTFSQLLSLRKYFGLFGFGLAALHALISLLIFGSSYYPKFFATNGQLNISGELSMLFGVLGFFTFLLVALSSLPSISDKLDKQQWLYIQKLGYLGLTLVLLHVIVMGFDGWLKPETWPGKLLPISLVSAISIMATLLLKLLSMIFSMPKDDKNT